MLAEARGIRDGELSLELVIELEIDIGEGALGTAA